MRIPIRAHKEKAEFDKNKGSDGNKAKASGLAPTRPDGEARGDCASGLHA
jgi:hypothetical protein